MNIELLFIQKAIKEKNYLNFYYKNHAQQKIQPKKLKEEKGTLFLLTICGKFEVEQIKKLTVLKERF